MPHYVIVAAGVVTEAFTTPFDPNLGREKAADWTEVENEAVAPGWTTSDGGKTFAPPVVEPVAPRARAATTYQLMSALTDAQRAAYPGPIKAWDQRLFSARDTPWPETNEKIGRIADALGTSAKAWFDRVFTPAS